MPVDFNTGERYKFDFKKLISPSMVLYHTNEYNKYLNEWINLLIALDNSSMDEYNHFVLYCGLDMNKAPEFFQYKQAYVTNEPPYIYNFNIDRIIYNSKESETQINYALVSKLVNRIVYNSQIILDGRKVKKEPIILCELYMPKYHYLVIDGNTRLNYWLKHHKIIAEYVIYSPTKQNEFLSSVDWAMYNFINEIHTILQDYKNDELMQQHIQTSKIYDKLFIEECHRKYEL